MMVIFPEVVALASTKQLEKLAVAVRSYFLGKAGHNPKINIEELVEHCGLNVEEQSFAHHGALLVKDEHGRPSATIFLRAGIAADQKKFLLAHILGHFMIHVQPKVASGDWKTGGFKELADPMMRYLEAATPSAEAEILEAEADDFAAALLLPPGMLKKAYQAFQDAQKVANFFGVTPALVQRRLMKLGLVAAPPVASKGSTKRGIARIREIAQNIERKKTIKKSV